MHVVDEEPYWWFLFRSGDELLLDVNCNHSAVGYEVLVRLNNQETEAYAREGREFLTRLAKSVHNAGPGSSLQRRNVMSEFSKEYSNALAVWRASME